MAVRLGDAVLFLGTDDSGLQRGLGDAEERTSSWGSALQGVMAGIGIAVADAAMGMVRGAVDQIGAAIGSASNLNETISKTGELFGDSTEKVLAWSDTASTAFGQSKQQALDAAANFAIFGRAAGLSGDDLVNFSTDFTTLATDLSSFNNTTPEQAIEAIGAALRGESEPLRAYGVLLDDATLKAAAFDLGLTTSANETLTQQQRVLAAQKVIYDQTTAQQGDFARTSDGLANSQRSLAAVWEDFRTKIGTIFLPVIEAGAGALKNLVEVVLPPLGTMIDETIVPAMQDLARGLGSIFSPERAQVIAEWVAGVVEGIGAFIGGVQGADEDASTYMDNLGRSVHDTAVNVGGDLDTMKNDFAVFASWFSSPEAGEPANWWIQLATWITETVGAIVQALTLGTHSLALFGSAIGAMVHGDWGAMGDADAMLREYLQGELATLMESINRLREIRGADPFDLSPYTGVQGEPQVTYTVNLPIVINAPGGNPDVVAQSANTGVTQALRAAGVTP